METIKTYTKEDLLLVIETMCEKHKHCLTIAHAFNNCTCLV